MNTLEHWNRAMAYIERQLGGEIDLQEAARLALCSEYHFKRMFSFLAGMPLAEYIRRRRLTLAAVELQTSPAKIIDIALTCGYDSPDAFARAFHALHGVTPSGARAGGQPLKAFPPMTFQWTVQGGSEMNYRLVEKGPFAIVGFMKRVPLVFSGVNPAIAGMWSSLDMETILRLKMLSDIEPIGLLSASVNFSEGRMDEQGELDHYIGVATTATEAANQHGMARLEVPASTWAVFTAVGPFPETLQNVWGRIYAEWFPSTGYESTGGPELLWNESKDMSSPTYKSEIWIPVRKSEAAR
ncbi:AraC family transcriptional regulator [Paenibacillus cymbidii]|uniref:AraC family transcriptional regulator n=1 Tax=Paenibacillus cymbidii TaxID=1639034 RepID=UPI001081B8E3|nr:AraC family transcriptional regulator [Paenibacillus cymbidii]